MKTKEHLQERAVQIFLYKIEQVLEKDLSSSHLRDTILINIAIISLINKGELVVKEKSFFIIDINKNIITEQSIENSLEFLKNIIEQVGELKLFNKTEKQEYYYLELNVDKLNIINKE